MPPFKIKKPAAAKKPAAPKKVPTPAQTRAPEVEGIFNDPVRQPPAVPPPTFEQADDDPLTGALNGELERLGQQDLNASRNQFGVQGNRLQEDLATRLANLQLQRTQATEDVRRQQDEIRRKAPIVQRDIAARQAGRGGYFSSAREEEQADATRQSEEAIQSGERALQRGEQEFQSAEQDAKRDAERARQDLEAGKAEFERKVKEGEFKSAAAAAKAGRESQKTEAKEWTNMRFNELLASGKSGEDARSLAINEARKAYPKVGDTYIVGSLGQKGAEKAMGKQTTKRYGSPITAERARILKPRTQASLRRKPLFNPLLATGREYLRTSGGDASADGVLRYLESDLANDFLSSPAGAGLDMAEGLKQARLRIGRNPELMSMILLDLGIL